MTACYHVGMIYLDYHATTPCDPRVVEAMLPYLTDQFANPHSDSHEAGRAAADALAGATNLIAELVNTPAESLLITSGATESINLAMRGVMTHPRNRRRKMIVAATEHPAVLDVAADLRQSGVEVVIIGTDRQGRVDPNELAETVDEQTSLVNVMLANNEMGVITSIKQVARIVHDAGALLHCDATQAVGRIPVDVRAMDIDLMSASAHKFYGPKGVGFLVAGNGQRRVRLRPQIVGGGQQNGLRSGTMNPAGVIAMAKALELAIQSRTSEAIRIASLRNRLWAQLADAIEGLSLNGPELGDGSEDDQRLPGNLNFRLQHVEGESWMAATPAVAFSSGSACSSADPTPSHVLTAIGLSESEARRSVRFGIGRFTTQAEIDRASDLLIAAHQRLHRFPTR